MNRAEIPCEKVQLHGSLRRDSAQWCVILIHNNLNRFDQRAIEIRECVIESLPFVEFTEGGDIVVFQRADVQCTDFNTCG